MSDCFKSFPATAKILIFAAQEHHQYLQSEAMIIINESHFLAIMLHVGSAPDLQEEKGKEEERGNKVMLFIWSQKTRNEQSVTILSLLFIVRTCLPQ